MVSERGLDSLEKGLALKGLNQNPLNRRWRRVRIFLKSKIVIPS